MLPTLKPGQVVWVWQWAYLFSQPKVNDIVTFQEGNKVLVKRVSSVGGGKVIVAGDNKEDSLDLPPVAIKSLTGKVIFNS